MLSAMRDAPTSCSVKESGSAVNTRSLAIPAAAPVWSSLLGWREPFRDQAS
jgi:hypothetical protein